MGTAGPNARTKWSTGRIEELGSQIADAIASGRVAMLTMAKAIDLTFAQELRDGVVGLLKDLEEAACRPAESTRQETTPVATELGGGGGQEETEAW